MDPARLGQWLDPGLSGLVRHPGEVRHHQEAQAVDRCPAHSDNELPGLGSPLPNARSLAQPTCH